MQGRFISPRWIVPGWAPQKGNDVARPAYLHRRPDGRYCIRMRQGKRAQEIHGRPLLRVSLRTANFQEARRRLVVTLGWAMDIVQAPGLETPGDN
ncbi:hypothetical protein WN73_03930 [Bradyrhizobium sp. CCBAU 45394]|nr:hypothetical protein [Bradyrhizobium sp. CCBAU 45394]MDA9540156.1 hypothetical protein [Bradyrhizobium sp. CCBAU 21362]